MPYLKCLMALRKRPFKGNKGLDQAKDNLAVDEEGDCPRCGGKSVSSSIQDYIICDRCQYEWKDPNAQSTSKRHPQESVHTESEMVRQFKEEMESGVGLSRVLGIDENLTREQQEGLTRLQDKWIEGMQGHYNAASEERKPLIINFDEEDNIIETNVGSLTILNNDFDGGEEIRIEYPGKGTEFYLLNEDTDKGWRRGRTVIETARNIASIINRKSDFVYAEHEGNTVSFELRDNSLNPKALVLYVDDPGSQDMIAEKDGVTLDPSAVSIESDYQTAVELVLSDGVITPSEDQLLWAMRQHLDISEERHIQIIVALFGDGAMKECTGCAKMAPLFTEHNAWYCDGCDMWL
ncbi:MAG: hypothetical protein QF807_01095 [Candidatus Thalassarchaeaceae archaeon]|nr:hypothetical protein [Candidatus Thalassarchaeaceae archaeon]MDP7042599.1 hypothetical protein [Candidatus Thalassarchaeaceae archaeon]